MYNRKIYLNRVSKFIDVPLIKIITGMRRAGKSSFMKLLITELTNKNIGEERIVYINMELFQFSDLRDARDLYNHVKEQYELVGKKIYLFLDEVQEIIGWEKAVISIFTEAIADIYIIGSNARLLSSELATFLSGKYIEFPVYSLTFSEYMVFRDQSEKKECFKDFLKHGGFPGIHHGQVDDEIVYQNISSIFDSIVLKDIVKRNNLRNVALLEKIFFYIAENIGSITSAGNVAKHLKKSQKTLGLETVYNYIRHLEDAFIIFKVPRFDIKGKKFLEVSEKYFLGDIALRNALLGYPDDDINCLLENIVFLELKKRYYKISTGKLDDKKIDFIIEKNNQKAYIQVCYKLASQEIIDREFSSLLAIKDNYPKYVISMDEKWADDFNGIKRVNLVDFLTSWGV